MVAGRLAMKAASSADGARSLRIAYLLSQYPVPTQTFARSDVEALRELGHEVSIFTMKPARKAESDEDAVLRPSFGGLVRSPLALWRSRRALPFLLRAIGGAFRAAPGPAITAILCLPRAAEIADQIAQGRYDVVHLFWARHAALVLAMLEARGAGALRSVFVGAYDLVADDFLVQLALGSAQFAVSHAEVNRAYLETAATPGTPTAIIRRGIPLLPLSPPAPRDPHLWMTASALVPEKNVAAVITAFARARPSDGRLKLEIYGDGPERAALGALAGSLDCAGRIAFKGHVGRERLFRAMERADTFVLLSKKPSERLPNVIKEALWAGCYVVSSNSPGIEELLPDPALGRIVDPDDGDAVSLAMKTAIARDHGAEAARIERARAHIAGSFSAERSMAQYVKHWRAAMDGVPAGRAVAGARAA